MCNLTSITVVTANMGDKLFEFQRRSASAEERKEVWEEMKERWKQYSGKGKGGQPN